MVRVIGFVLAIGVTQAWGEVETEREITRTYVNFYISQGKFVSAAKRLKSHLAQDPEDVGAWNMLGLAQLELNENSKATSAFVRAVKKSTGETKAIYLYHYANALTRIGKLGKARKALKWAARSDTIQDSAENALSVMKAGKDLPALELKRKSEWNGTVSATTGYDTNVLYTPDSNLATSANSGAASAYGVINPAFLYTKPSGDSTFNVSINSAFTYYVSSDSQTYNSWTSVFSFYNEALPAAFDGTYQSYGADVGSMFLNQNSFGLYSYYGNGYYQFLFKHGSQSDSKIKVTGGYSSFIDSTSTGENDRSGLVTSLDFSHQKVMGPGVFKAALEYTRTWASGTNYRSHGWALSASYRMPFFWEMESVFEAEPQFIYFDSASEVRTDPQIKLYASFAKPLSHKWNLSLDYTFRKNFSNQSTYAYTKHNVSLVMVYAM